MTARLRLGIDVGGTKTAAAMVTEDGTLRAIRSAPSGRGPGGVVDVAVRLASEVLREVGVDVGGGAVGGDGAALGVAVGVAVGACMPGLVDPATGLVRHAVNLEVDSLDLGGELTARLGVPVAVENDVKAAALGAWRLRSTGSSDSVPTALAYLNLGTGLASAVVRDGVVVRGIDGAAGEIGHLPVGGDAPCTCGQVGCLETIASGSALARLWPESRRLARDPFAAAAAGDIVAAAAVDVLCTGVGLAVQVLALASGAEQVVIGGGLAALGRPLLDGARADLRRRARSAQLLDALGLPDRVELLPADLPVAALGAAWLGTVSHPAVRAAPPVAAGAWPGDGPDGIRGQRDGATARGGKVG
ncbi:ROK family protein [Terrabacter sp. MAHUQ-38]|uniref:ROK family protein n=1 Tax=unclassified Terrabacter TaxID=2630222 RepID=UPI00165DE662|nr:ROK family protein [Terrabacter sp. MAHUQ-38]MBC9820370.1 ROK family protein [Terrabacter sp. MAHUQ-38]